MNPREWTILIAAVAICGFIVWDAVRLNRSLRIRQRLAAQNKPASVGTWLARHPR